MPASRRRAARSPLKWSRSSRPEKPPTAPDDVYCQNVHGIDGAPLPQAATQLKS